MGPPLTWSRYKDMDSIRKHALTPNPKALLRRARAPNSRIRINFYCYSTHAGMASYAMQTIALPGLPAWTRVLVVCTVRKEANACGSLRVPDL
jgi:hypothetical protein